MGKLIEAAMAADNAWSYELRQVYGEAAGDARYDARGFATTILAELKTAKIAADEACYSRRLPQDEVSL